MKNKLTILVFSLISLYSFAQTWGLDQDFNTSGFNATNLIVNGDDNAECLAIQNDGKILIAGSGLRLVRYNTNGSLDTSFNSVGYSAPFGNNTSLNFINQIIVKPDNKIVVIGNLYTNKYFLYLAQYNSNGSLDVSFGSGGRRIIDLGTGIFGYSVENALFTSQGELLISGNSFNAQDGDFSIIRCTSSGDLDTTFGTNGIITIDGMGNDLNGKIAVRTDGKILLSGNSNINPAIGTQRQHAIFLFNSNGSLDTTFGTNGKIFTNLNANNSQIISSLNLVENDKIIIAGQLYNSLTNQLDFFIAKYNSAGILDTSFGIDGKSSLNFDEFFQSQKSDDFIESLSIQVDGKIVVAGYSRENLLGSNNQFALARLNPEGTVDSTFGQNGKIVMPISGFSDVIYDVKTQNDGKIIVAGMSKINATDRSYIVARYTPDSTLSTIQNYYTVTKDLEIFPNPVRDKLNIVSTKLHFLNENTTFSIYALDGRMMKEITFNKLQLSNNEIAIDINDLPSGFYFISLSDGTTQLNKKFIKE